MHEEWCVTPINWSYPESRITQIITSAKLSSLLRTPGLRAACNVQVQQMSRRDDEPRTVITRQLERRKRIRLRLFNPCTCPWHGKQGCKSCCCGQHKQQHCLEFHVDLGLGGYNIKKQHCFGLRAEYGYVDGDATVDSEPRSIASQEFVNDCGPSWKPAVKVAWRALLSGENFESSRSQAPAARSKETKPRSV